MSAVERVRLLRQLYRRLLRFPELDSVLSVLATHWPELFIDGPAREVPAAEQSAARDAELAKAHQTIAELTEAVASNRQIGAAVGVLMAQHRITQHEAFQLLRRHSQQTHRKLRDVADDVLFTGTLED